MLFLFILSLPIIMGVNLLSGVSTDSQSCTLAFQTTTLGNQTIYVDMSEKSIDLRKQIFSTIDLILSNCIADSFDDFDDGDYDCEKEIINSLGFEIKLSDEQDKYDVYMSGGYIGYIRRYSNEIIMNQLYIGDREWMISFC